MYRWRLAAGIALCVALAAALVVVLTSNRTDRGLTAATSTPSERASPTPTPSATPLAVPTPNTTGRDFERIYREINAFRDWLYEHPNPDLVGLIYHPSCECYAELQKALRNLIRIGLHFEDSGFEIRRVEVVEDFGDVARLRVVLRRTPQILLNKDREVVRRTAGRPPTVYSFLIERSPRRWRVRSITEVGAA